MEARPSRTDQEALELLRGKRLQVVSLQDDEHPPTIVLKAEDGTTVYIWSSEWLCVSDNEQDVC